MHDDQYWEAVVHRDAAYDGTFVYAVKTTGIYCRPSCPSRRAFRQNVVFYSDAERAEAAGFRACQRCHPHQQQRIEPRADVVVEICRFLEASDGIPTLKELGERFHLSPYHLQRTFKRIVGVSPRQYADVYRQGRLKAFLKAEPTVTAAIYAAGYNTSSSVYEDAHHILGTTPIHYRNGGEDLTVKYVITTCSLGYLLIAATEQGICKVSLGDSIEALRDELGDEFPRADLIYDEDDLGAWSSAIITYMDGGSTVLDLPLDIQATGFQRKVWEALRDIPYGSTCSYQDIADHIGQPTATRAVAQAISHNPVALVIPCHRVIRADGQVSGYRWGVERKEALLIIERSYA